MVNMDETSVKLAPLQQKGWVMGGRRKRKAILRSGNACSLKERRSAVSLISFVADNEAVQGMLPHIFLGNSHILTLGDVQELNSSTAPNILFSRRQSGWVNSKTMIEVVRVLAASLGSVMKTCRVVLSFDTYRAHIHLNVIQECNRLGLMVLPVPATMTKWLQPLDIAVFKKYKEWVIKELERRRVASPSASLSTVQVLTVYAEGIGAVIEKQSWSTAFDSAGMRGQSQIPSSMLQRLGCGGPFNVLPTLPTAADLVAVYPRRSQIPVEQLFELPVKLAREPRPLLLLPRRARLTMKSRPPPPLPPHPSFPPRVF